MDAVTVVAIVGTSSTLLSAGFAGWATVKQRRTEETRLGYDAMRDALANYRSDNDDLRQRVFAAEQHVVDLTGKVNRCESDKAILEVKAATLESKASTLETEVADLRRRLDDA